MNPESPPAPGRVLVAGLLIGLAAGTVTLAEEAVLLADQSDGAIDVEGISRLEVTGIHGTLTLRSGQGGKLQFACRSLDNRREERPVALWETDSALRLSFSEQLEPQRLLLDVAVPPNMSAVIRADDSKLTVTSLQGSVSVTGTDLVFGGRNLQGDLELNINGGSVTVLSGAGDVRVAGRDVNAKLTQIQGDVEATLVGGRLDLLEVLGSVSLDLEETDASAEIVGREFEAQATGGNLAFKGLGAGGVFEMSGASLSVTASTGDMDVESDAQIEFANVDGTLRVRSYGGGLTVAAATGQLQFEGRDSQVRLTQMGAAAVIIGDSLNVQIEGIVGDLTVNTTSSQVNVANAEGLVDLTNDFGDVTLAKASKAVKIVSRDGIVAVTDLEAPADVKADGPQVTVHWSGASNQANSSVENASGDVRLLFSPKGGGRLEAEASSGRIESSLAGVTVNDDGTRAAGLVNRKSTPNIRVVSAGDVYLAGAAQSELMKPKKPVSAPANLTRPKR